MNHQKKFFIFYLLLAASLFLLECGEKKKKPPEEGKDVAEKDVVDVIKAEEITADIPVDKKVPVDIVPDDISVDKKAEEITPDIPVDKKVPVDIVPDDIFVEVVQGITVKEACEIYRKALCDRHIVCGTFPTQSACYDWFNKNYGACEDAPTDKLSTEKEAYLIVCVEELKTADCDELSEYGAEATVPACAKF